MHHVDHPALGQGPGPAAPAAQPAQPQPKRRVIKAPQKNIDAAVDMVLGGASKRSAAATHGVGIKVINRGLRERAGVKKHPGRPRVLSPVLEALIVTFLLQCVRANLPQPVSELGRIATFLVRSSVGAAMAGSTFKACADWREAFFKRHRDLLRRKSAHPVPSTRFAKMTVAVCTEWMDIVKAAVLSVFDDTDEFDARRFLAMDETPFNPFPGKKMRAVIGERGRKATLACSPNKEFFTGVVTVNAAGDLLQPMFIFKGKRLRTELFGGFSTIRDPNHPEAKPKKGRGPQVAATKKGQMTEEAFSSYLSCLHDQLRKDGVQFPVLLLVDNHSSHVTWRNMKKVIDLGINLLCLPSQTTVRLRLSLWGRSA